MLPNCFGDCALTYFDGTGDELGDVVGVQLIVVEGARVTLRQDERFGTLAVVVDVGEIGTDIKTIDASATETYPMAVVAPCVVAFAVT